MGRLQHFLHCNVVKTESAKMMTYVERETMAMLHRAFYARDDSFYEAHAMDRDTCLGHPTSGGTVANLEALWVARNTLFEGCNKRGLAQADSCGEGVRERAFSMHAHPAGQLLHALLTRLLHARAF